MNLFSNNLSRIICNLAIACCLVFTPCNSVHTACSYSLVCLPQWIIPVASEPPQPGKNTPFTGELIFIPSFVSKACVFLPSSVDFPTIWWAWVPCGLAIPTLLRFFSKTPELCVFVFKLRLGVLFSFASAFLYLDLSPLSASKSALALLLIILLIAARLACLLLRFVPTTISIIALASSKVSCPSEIVRTSH